MTFPRISTGITTMMLACISSAQAYEPYGIRFYHHASTAGQGYLDGIANGIGATGHAVRMLNEALIAREEARRIHLENRLRYVQDYYAKRQFRDEYRRYQRRHSAGGRRQHSQLQEEEEDKNDETQAQDQQTVVENASHGRSPAYYVSCDEAQLIPWPRLLCTTPFDSDRLELERLISEVRVGGGVSPTDYARMRGLGVSMRLTLQDLDQVVATERSQAEDLLVSVIRKPGRMLEKWTK